MASETLIRQAEKMYGSMADTTDYAKLLTQPFVDEMNKNLETQRLKTEALIATMPAGVNISKVPEELQGVVTDYLTENKAAYVEASKVIGSGIKPTDPRYLEAMEKMNQIRGGFEALDANLVKLAENRKLSLDNIDNISPGASPWQETLQNRFANGSIYKDLTLRDGNFYYKGEGDEEINTNDYRLGPQQQTALTETMQTSHDHAIDQKYRGNKFDGRRYRGIIKANLKKAGKDGRVDFAYSGLYGDESGQTEFIDKWIDEKHGVTRESNLAEFERLYQSLKNEDFSSNTEIGRKLEDYLVNTVEDSYNGAKTAVNKNVTKTDYGREFGGIWRNDQLVREKTTAVNNQQPFWDFGGTKWNPIGGDMFEDEAGNKKNKFDIAVDNDFPMQLMTGENPGYTSADVPSVDVPKFDPEFKGRKIKLTDFEKQQKEMMEVMEMKISKAEKDKKLKEIQKKYK